MHATRIGARSSPHLFFHNIHQAASVDHFDVFPDNVCGHNKIELFFHYFPSVVNRQFGRSTLSVYKYRITLPRRH